jgi:hypothetical protein
MPKPVRKKYTLSLDPNVVEPLKERLKEENVSFSGFVNALAADSLEAMKNLPENLEDMTVKQFAEFINLFVKTVKG